MQSWSVEELEKHVALLQQLNRPVPQYVGLLLTEARRKQKKKHAKRIANRRSASTSRARKKKYVEEMKVTNARLKRQALILSLLPDLVVAINTDGEITFCSAQVERVLKHKIEDLIGANLSTLLVPASKDALQSLINEMMSGEKEEPSPESAPPAGVDLESKRRRIEKRESGAETDRAKAAAPNRNNGNGSGSGRSSDNTANAAIVSEQSFPLSVVEVDSKQAGRTDINTEQNEGSDASTNNSNGKAQMSSLTTSTRSPTVSSGDEKAAREGGSRGSNDGSANAKRAPSSDDSSSLSSDAKNMSKANENLDRNVRRHNQKMMEVSKKKGHDGPKDDVTGASVTRNNATARLSSLKHVPDSSKNKDEKGGRYESNGDQSSSDDSLLAGVEEKKKAAENASDDSGYRESNDSREESSSSGSDTSNSNGQQKKPLAATCRMCLIRQDLTTVWCEVTSSVRTRLTDEESFDSPSNPSKSGTATQETPAPPKEEMLEILLCLRPIRNGEKSVDESLRFVPVERAEATMDEVETGERIVSSGNESGKKIEFVSGSGSGSGSGGSGSKDNDTSGKRTLSADEERQSKKQKTEKGKPSTLDTVQAVESLMCLNKSSQ
jgi:PAS domain-containing protein